MKLTLVTGNPNKAKETQGYTSIELDHQAVDLPEIQSLDVYEIVLAKAQAAFDQLQKPVIVEDTGLVFPFMGRLPGTFIKFFLSELKPEGMCRLADADPERRAVASVTYGVHDGTEVHIFTGIMSGMISQEPAGENGFGWDSIFIPDGADKTWASMTTEEQAPLSIRRQALAKIETWLAART